MEHNKKNERFLNRVGSFFKPRPAGRRAVSPADQESVVTAPAEKCAVRLDMEARLRGAGRPLPTEDQWSMILAPGSSVRVVAGAGSGKSTTLVLRIIAMSVYRGLPMSVIRVVTFTRNSRADFIEKLRSTAQIWDIDLGQREASAVVRTFHSLVFAQATAAGLNTKTLDQLDSGGAGHSAASPFPALSVDPGSDLAVMLNDAARQLMQTTPSFAGVISQLYTHSFLTAGGMPLDDSKAGRVLAVQAHDYERTAYMETFWRQKVAPGLMNSPLIEWRLDTFCTGPVVVNGKEAPANGPWWANGFIPKLNAWVLLGGTPRIVRAKTMPDGFAMAPALGAKKSCVNVLTSNENVIWLNSEEDLAALHMRLKWGEEQSDAFPKFGVRLTGEVATTPLLIAIWQQAQFIQSLGLDVVEAAREAAAQVSGVDMLFAKALALFWPAFESLVRERGYTLSNSIFQQLSQPEVLQKLPDNAVFGVQHLLIDEFQDISGIIVNWLQAVRSEIERRGATTSLMVVGDDWQSIYGWRGASPRYFTDFFRYFPAEPHECQTVYLSENFRSSQAIVTAAGEALAHVTEKIDKRCIAQGQYADLDEPVTLLRLDDDEDLLSGVVDDYLMHRSLFIIGRTRNSLAAFAKSEKPCMTIHASKGLEADYVLMVDDFAPPATYPLRCVWYAKAGLGDYDKAQNDETMRLAYVAITRAKKGCLWAVRGEAANGVFGRFLSVQIPEIRTLEAMDG